MNAINSNANSAAMASQRDEVLAAVDALRRGGLIGLPTETVYGLGADASNPEAVARIFAAKKRPTNHPLIVHLHRKEQLTQWAYAVPAAAWRLAEAFWPGPLTLVLKRAPGVLDAVTGGLDTVALRVPAHPLALEVLAAFGGGIAAPSANRHKKISPTSARHVRQELGDAVDVVLDGGDCRVGIESTIVDLSTGTMRLLRPGAITTRDLEQTVAEPVDPAISPVIRSPGRMPLHYAPDASVVLASMEDVPAKIAEYTALGVRMGVLSEARASAWPDHIPWLPMGNTASEQAHQLYRRLREADEMGLAALIVVPPSDRGLGYALCDRLCRAAGLGALLA
jgi:L-threonylcarbamoyladenylate synthase